MKKHSILFFLLAGVLFLAIESCSLDGNSSFDSAQSDEPSSLQITVRGEFGSSPLVMLEDYSLDSETDILISRLSFFVNDLSLMGASGDYQIDDIRMVNLTDSHSNLEGAQKGLTFTINNLDAGTYNGLKFGLGVASADNARKPEDYDVSSPLNNPAEYWQGWESYVFSKLEGKVDFDKTMTGFDRDMSLHVGGDDVYSIISIPKSIVLNPGQTTNLNWTVDAKEILFPTGGTAFDLETRSQLHSTTHKPLMLELTNNMPSAMSLN